jgi:hypothetical protein
MTSPSTARGSALLEAMIALTILLVGMLGMAQLQFVGLTANQGSRANTTASEYAADLLSSLKKLPWADARLNSAVAPTNLVAGAPNPWGSMLAVAPAGGTCPAGTHSYTELAPWPGPANTAPAAVLEPDPLNLGTPLYKRCWMVWDYQAPSGSAVVPTKLIAIAVMYRERTLPALREVVVYGQLMNPLALNVAVAP